MSQKRIKKKLTAAQRRAKQEENALLKNQDSALPSDLARASSRVGILQAQLKKKQ